MNRSKCVFNMRPTFRVFCIWKDGHFFDERFTVVLASVAVFIFVCNVVVVVVIILDTAVVVSSIAWFLWEKKMLGKCLKRKKCKINVWLSQTEIKFKLSLISPRIVIIYTFIEQLYICVLKCFEWTYTNVRKSEPVFSHFTWRVWFSVLLKYAQLKWKMRKKKKQEKTKKLSVKTTL